MIFQHRDRVVQLPPGEFPWPAVHPDPISPGYRPAGLCPFHDHVPFELRKSKHTWKVTKKATCTSGGTRTCSVCGATEETPALGHAWETTYESIWMNQCNDCGSLFNQGDLCPNWSIDSIEHHAYHTVVEQGNPITVCSRCGARQ